ncbi:MAG: phosphotyrosine protein phosphatase [Candidatus Omnitrophica bacterium]|nr:phosphotyrosine protein phosphatase [Candidatus Omnitrophota bacterium]
MKNVLFVCSQNKLRSPTAEAIFAGIEGLDVRSAGLNNSAAVQVSSELITWAEYIFVMEQSHRNKLRKKFRNDINKQRIICLNIPDDYAYMDPELIEILKLKMGSFFNLK